MILTTGPVRPFCGMVESLYKHQYLLLLLLFIIHFLKFIIHFLKFSMSQDISRVVGGNGAYFSLICLILSKKCLVSSIQGYKLDGFLLNALDEPLSTCLHFQLQFRNMKLYAAMANLFSFRLSWGCCLQRFLVN